MESRTLFTWCDNVYGCEGERRKHSNVDGMPFNAGTIIASICFAFMLIPYTVIIP